MTKVKKVLIVGGGVGGLSTAIAFRKIGIDVEIAEIHKEFNVYGVGIILPPNTLRALDQLGVLERTLKGGAKWKNWNFFDGEGNFLVEPETPAADHIDYYGGLSRRHLHSVLYETALELGTKIRMGTSVESIEDQENCTIVKLTDGYVGEYDFVIGADGAYSKIRKMLFPDKNVKFVGEGVWRYPFRNPKGFDKGVMYLGKNGKAGLVPMSDDSLYLFLVTIEPENKRKNPEKLDAILRDHLQEFGGLIAELRKQITDPKQVIYRPIETLIVDGPWHRGRTLLIGDAAHATAPHLAQGAGISIEDAIVLGDLVNQELEIPELFEAFMKERFERCKLVVESSDLLVDWEIRIKKGEPLPLGANIPKKMDEVTLKMTEPILSMKKI